MLLLRGNICANPAQVKVNQRFVGINLLSFICELISSICVLIVIRVGRLLVHGLSLHAFLVLLSVHTHVR